MGHQRTSKDIKYYTTREAAQIMRVSYKTILRWIASGKIKAKRIGHKWLIPKEEIE